jgi:Tfp pilus assembly protein PilE
MFFKNTAMKEGFSLVDVILGVTFFSIFFSILLTGFSTLVQRQEKVKMEVYNVLEKTNEISETYYIDSDRF